MPIGIIAAAAISAGASLGGAAMNAGAASDAADASTAAANSANALQKYMYDTNNQMMSPWRSAGQQGLNSLLAGLGLLQPPGQPSLSNYIAYDSNTGKPLQGAPGQSQNWNGKTYSYDPNTGYLVDQTGYQAAMSDYMNNLAFYNSSKDNGTYGNITKQLQTGMQNTNSLWNDLQPNLKTAGNTYQAAATNLNNALTPFSYDPAKDPLYQWELSQGTQAINNSAAASGKYFSGDTGLALQNFGQNTALNSYQTEFGNWLNNQASANSIYGNAAGVYGNMVNTGEGIISLGDQEANQLYNWYAGLSGTGMNSTTTTGNWGANYADTAGNNLINAANNAGGYNLAGANAWGNGMQGVGNQVMGGIGAYNNNNMLQTLINQNAVNQLQMGPGGYGAGIVGQNDIAGAYGNLENQFMNAPSGYIGYSMNTAYPMEAYGIGGA